MAVKISLKFGKDDIRGWKSHSDNNYNGNFEGIGQQCTVLSREPSPYKSTPGESAVSKAMLYREDT